MIFFMVLYIDKTIYDSENTLCFCTTWNELTSVNKNIFILLIINIRNSVESELLQVPPWVYIHLEDSRLFQACLHYLNMLNESTNTQSKTTQSVTVVFSCA